MAISKKDHHIETYYGISSDEKPPAPPVGSTFFEQDSQRTFRYMGTWEEIITLASIEANTDDDAYTLNWTDGKVTSITRASDGLTMTLTYTDGNLTSISNWEPTP